MSTALREIADAAEKLALRDATESNALPASPIPSAGSESSRSVPSTPPHASKAGEVRP